jgi:hypothetical protein
VTAETQERPSDEKSKQYVDETRDVTKEKDLKSAVEKEPVLTAGTKEVLHEIAREKRERKATKADDAAVPEYLWEKHLLNDCPTPWVLKERTRLRKAIRLFRARMPSYSIIPGMDEDGACWTNQEGAPSGV